jgi:aspartate aminotransferase
MQNFTASKTMALNTLAKQMEKAGHAVCNLTVGEPSEDTPEHIKDAIIKALRDGDTKYTQPSGKPEHRAVIATTMQRDYGLSYDAEQVIISVGGKQVIENAFHATLNPGDEVVLFEPYWTSYRDLVRMYDGVPVPVLTTAASGFKPMAEDLDRAISAKTKWVVVNSCNNPTGAKYSRADLLALAAVLRQKRCEHVWILSDDIYEKLAYDGQPFCTLAQLGDDLRVRTLILNGLSKSYMATGLRIGWGVGDAKLIAAMGAIQSQTISGAAAICQAAIPAALNGPQGHHAVQLARYRARRDLVVQKIRSIPGLDCTEPLGAFYVLADISGWFGKTTPDGDILHNDEAVCDYLLRRHFVATVPGSGFGAASGQFLRIAYAKDDAILAEALNRIAQAADQLR